MTNDDDVVRPGVLDIADERVDLVGDGHLPQVPGLAPPSRHVEGEQRSLWRLPMNFVDGEVPRIGGESAAVHENQRGQCHGGPP
jgi:hypothetical protein